MTRDGIRPIAALAAAALLALLLAACGGGSSSESAGAGTSTSQAEREAAKEKAEAKAKELKEKSGSGGTKSQGGNGSGSEGAKKKANVDTPLKVSGGGSKQFVVKGGDNSIQEYGEEKGESELTEAAEAVHGFFVARAEGRWADACGYLSKALLKQLGQLAAKSERKSCASFLIYYGAPKKTVYAMPLKYEGGEWKVGALSGDALQG